MPWLDRFRRTRQTQEELDQEIRFHLAEEARLRVERGESSRDAQRHARRDFGSTIRAHEEIDRLVPSRALEIVWLDLKYGLRLLRRDPTFAAAAILSLALGIGANTAIFQLLEAIRLRTLPVTNPTELAEVRLVLPEGAGDDGRSGGFTGERPELTNPLWEQIRDRQQGFSSIFAWGATTFEMAVAGESQPASGLYVSGEFFRTLNVQPVLGRVFTAGDDTRGCAFPGAVVSHAFWQRRFGADPQILRRSLRIDGQLFPILGVTPQTFFGVDVGSGFDVALPICAERLTRGSRSKLDVQRAWWLAAIGRLKPGWTIAQASTQLNAISPPIFAATVSPTYPPATAKRYLNFRLGSFPAATGVSSFREGYETPLWLLLGIAALVLLIGCANLANLMLARATAREQEIAVRLAIGASRGRILRQLLAESLLLAACGTTLGVLLSQTLSTSLVSLFGDAVMIDLQRNWRVLGFTMGLAAGACLLFGLAPAIRATRTEPATVMRANSRSATTGRESVGLRRGLVIAQVALSIVLVASALLFVRTLQNLATTDPGFHDDGVLIARLDFRQSGVPDAGLGALKHELLERIRSAPGVQAAASVFHPPISGGGWNENILIDGVIQKRGTYMNWISSGYFAAMKTPLIEGRDFEEHDTAAMPPVAIVNHAFAQAFFGGRDSLGRRFQIETGPGEPRPAYEIVGLVGDTKYLDLREPFSPIAFVSTWQDSTPRTAADIVVRSNLPWAVATSVKDAVRTANAGVLVKFQTMASQIEKSMLRERLMATLSGFFGALAALLSSVGLYGVMSYSVARRRNEIGIRMALGADRLAIVRMVLREALVLLAVGGAMGLLLSAAAGRAIASLLYGLQPHDPTTLGLAVAGLTGVGALASYLPARRASRLEPTAVLRKE